MTTIKRVSDAKYVLESASGDEIAQYDTARMEHPNDWINDARDAGESVHGPYDWQFVDARE